MWDKRVVGRSDLAMAALDVDALGAWCVLCPRLDDGRRDTEGREDTDEARKYVALDVFRCLCSVCVRCTEPSCLLRELDGTVSWRVWLVDGLAVGLCDDVAVSWRSGREEAGAWAVVVLSLLAGRASW